jgi:hypothetical protein
MKSCTPESGMEAGVLRSVGNIVIIEPTDRISYNYNLKTLIWTNCQQCFYQSSWAVLLHTRFPTFPHCVVSWLTIIFTECHVVLLKSHVFIPLKCLYTVVCYRLLGQFLLLQRLVSVILLYSHFTCKIGLRHIN